MKAKILLIAFLLLNVTLAWANHNRSGEILYKRIPPYTSGSGPVYNYSITVIKYTDDGPTVADRCVDTVNFGDGTKGVALRINGPTGCTCGTISCGEIIVNEQGYIIKKNIYTITHTYAPGVYTIYSADPNRSSGIANIPNSASQLFYLEAQLVVNSMTGINSSPILTNPPVDRGTPGSSTFDHNPAAFDPDGDSLSYEIGPCKIAPNNTVAGYSYPHASQNGTLFVNQEGSMIWFNGQIQNKYSIVLIIKEWRRPNCGSPYQMIGYVARDMEIIIANGGWMDPFSTNTFTDVCVSAGATITRTLYPWIQQTPLTVSLYGSSAYSGDLPNATLSTTNIVNNSPSVFKWQTNCSHVRKQPHEIELVYNIGYTPIPKRFSVRFSITVVPPSPLIYNITTDTSQVTLNWQSLKSCLPNLAGYKIYRKFGNNSWSRSTCEIGVPASSGFSLIGSASVNDNSYTDNDLWYIPNGSTGNYIVTAVTDDCAESFADNIQTLSLIVGLEENSPARELKVYPNPFRDVIEIDFDGASYQWTECSVYSSEGKLILRSRDEKVRDQLNLKADRLPPGLYFLRVETPNGVTYRKLMKE